MKKIYLLIAAIGLLLQTTEAQKDTTHPKSTIVTARIGVAPGLSTQGGNDRNTVSNLSLNVWGGITGGVYGLELGSLFNIDKMNMQYVQAAGLFNVVEGHVKGVQLAGLCNAVLYDVAGVQSAGLTNFAAKDVTGIQSAGIHNHAGGALKGIQSGGITNYAGSVRGAQLAGIANISSTKMVGLQAAGIFNYAKHLKGVQIGLINVADTSEGFSLGLINIVRKGYHKITLSTNEVLNANLAIKTGNAKLYNILMVGINAGSDDKCFSYGYGIGHEEKIGKRFTINPELTTQYMYLGNWHYHNQLTRLQVLGTIKLTKGLAMFAGPVFSAYYSEQPYSVKGYKFNMPSDSYHVFNLWNDNVTGWFGWTMGVSFL